MEIDDNGIAPKMTTQCKNKSKDETSNPHARIMMKQNGLSVGKELRNNSVQPNFDYEQKNSKHDQNQVSDLNIKSARFCH